MTSSDAPKSTQWLTKRFVFSLLVLILGTAMLSMGKLTGDNWVMMSFGVIAGHHAADIVKAWKGA